MRCCWPCCLAVSALILYFYALLLYASLVRAFGADDSLHLAHYQTSSPRACTAIRDTLIIAAIGMPLGGLYGVRGGLADRAAAASPDAG